VCRVHCATANPTSVVIAKTSEDEKVREGVWEGGDREGGRTGGGGQRGRRAGAIALRHRLCPLCLPQSCVSRHCWAKEG
jgi:hypothetical protein